MFSDKLEEFTKIAEPFTIHRITVRFDALNANQQQAVVNNVYLIIFNKI